MCASSMLLTGCALPPLPGFGVTADRPSRYYNDGSYYRPRYANEPYYANGPYYANTPYYSSRRYYRDGPY